MTTATLYKQALAFLLVTLFTINPPLAASSEPPAAKQCVALSNAFNLLPPTNPVAAAKSTRGTRKAITKNWTTWVNANSARLAVAESALLSNRAALITSSPSARPLHNGLQSINSNLTLKQVQVMSASTAEQRQRILNVIEAQGLAAVLGGLTNNKNPFVSGPQPADGYCYMEALGNDMMVLAAILAFAGQEEAAVPLAAAGAAAYFYGEYISCTIGSTGDDGGDFFITEGD